MLLFCNTFDLHYAIIGLENKFLVFLRVAVLYRFYCTIKILNSLDPDLARLGSKLFTKVGSRLQNMSLAVKELKYFKKCLNAIHDFIEFYF